MPLAAAILQRCCLDQRGWKAIQQQSKEIVLSGRRFERGVGWDLKWTNPCPVFPQFVLVQSEKGAFAMPPSLLLPRFSPINNHCLHWTLQHGHKMVFLSSLLDASPATLSLHCVHFWFFFNPSPSVHLSKDFLNGPIFFRADFCPPTNAHPTPYPTAPCPPHCTPPFLTHPSCIRCKKKKKKISRLSSKNKHNCYLSDLFFEEFIVNKKKRICRMYTWARVIRACLVFFQSKMTPCLCF